MSKELDEFYKRYSARITEIDDTPLVKVMDGGKFKLLSIEEYEEMTNKIADLEAKLSLTEKALELACESLDEHFWNCCPEIYSSTKTEWLNTFKRDAKKEMKK